MKLTETQKRALAAGGAVVYGLAILAMVYNPQVMLAMFFWIPFPFFPLPLPPLWFPG